MIQRPEWVKCALTGMYEGEPPRPVQKTWCGRNESGWAFTDASHALLNGLGGGRTMLCSECGDAIRDALTATTWRARPVRRRPSARRRIA